MFFDEDGDLAHEFYTEVRSQVSGVVTWTMKRVFEHLTPQVCCGRERGRGRV